MEPPLADPAASPALVVGGTGMLTGVVGELVRDGRTTAVLARSRGALERLASRTAPSGRVVPVPADYTDPGGLEEALRRAVRETGPFGVAVLWVRTAARQAAHEAVGRVLAPGALVVDIMGSAAADPSRAPEPVPGPFRAHPYRQVILGFTDDAAGTRWLDHAEICQGVLAAARAPERTHVVGRVRPWSDRP